MAPPFGSEFTVPPVQPPAQVTVAQCRRADRPSGRTHRTDPVEHSTIFGKRVTSRTAVAHGFVWALLSRGHGRAWRAKAGLAVRASSPPRPELAFAPSADSAFGCLSPLRTPTARHSGAGTRRVTAPCPTLGDAGSTQDESTRGTRHARPLYAPPLPPLSTTRSHKHPKTRTRTPDHKRGRLLGNPATAPCSLGFTTKSVGEAVCLDGPEYHRGCARHTALAIPLPPRARRPRGPKAEVYRDPQCQEI